MIKVFKISELIKYFIKIIIPLTIILVIVNVFNIKVDFASNNNESNALLFCLDENINELKIINSQEKEKETILKKVISRELSILENNMNNGTKVAKENEGSVSDNNEEDNNKSSNIESKESYNINNTNTNENKNKSYKRKYY